MQTVRFYKLDKLNYTGFRDKLIDLYLHAFTTGEYAQYIASETVASLLEEMLQEGSGNMAFVDDHLIGLLLTSPLKNDPYFPENMMSEIPVEQVIYIAEVMVHADYRGKGIASQMVKDLFQNLSKGYSHAVIRVWEKNIPALELYKKLGFVPTATISQKKLSLHREEFEMKKIYLSKLLS